MTRIMVRRLGVERAAVEGQAIERALFWGRCTGGVVIILLGPIVTPGVPDVVLRGLGLYFFAYAALMLAITRRAQSAAAQERAAWLAHSFDTIGFLAALVINATDPGWLAVYAAPLYILVAVTRMGLFGGISAAVALSLTHLALADWRQTALGIEFDLARHLVNISIYGLAALLTTAIDSELRALRRRERERNLADLERAQRLESLGALTGGIAHDFNNLLAVILNDAHLALRSTQGRAVRREIEEIEATAERGVSLTRQMLVFARGASSSATVPVDVRREITYAERLLRRALDGGVTVDVRVADDLPDVELEAGQVERMLVNLVVNARDAMPNGGRVSIDAREAQVGAHEVDGLTPGRYLRLVVSDEGLGMSPEIKRRAFEPFFTTKSKGHGTGLGLSTVHSVVRRAHGHVGIASTPGKGTAVTIHLPADGGAIARRPAPKLPAAEVREALGAHVEVA